MVEAYPCSRQPPSSSLPHLITHQQFNTDYYRRDTIIRTARHPVHARLIRRIAGSLSKAFKKDMTAANVTPILNNLLPSFDFT